MGSLRGVRSQTGASDRRPSRLTSARGTVRHRPVERPTQAKTGKLRAAGSQLDPADLEVPDSHRLPDNPGLTRRARSLV